MELIGDCYYLSPLLCVEARIMGKTKVLITSAGTGSGTSVIKALRHQSVMNLEIIATDADSAAPGLRLADRFYITPPCNDPNFLSTLRAISHAEGKLLVLPTFSREIEWFSRNQDALIEDGIHVFLPRPETVNICDNKVRFYEWAKKHDLRVPEAISRPVNGNWAEVDFPVFVKQTHGSGSQFALRIDNAKALDFYLAQKPNLLIQEFILGDEFTVDVFCDRQFRVRGISARSRLAIKNGQSVKGMTVPANPFHELIQFMATKLELVGACNFQFFLAAHETVLIEINPRFAAGGLMLSVEAGVNIPLMIVQELLGQLPSFSKSPCVEARPEVMMAKYWNEVFWESPSVFRVPEIRERATATTYNVAALEIAQL